MANPQRFRDEADARSTSIRLWQRALPLDAKDADRFVAHLAVHAKTLNCFDGPGCAGSEDTFTFQTGEGLRKFGRIIRSFHNPSNLLLGEELKPCLIGLKKVWIGVPVVFWPAVEERSPNVVNVAEKEQGTLRTVAGGKTLDLRVHKLAEHVIGCVEPQIGIRRNQADSHRPSGP